MRDETEVYQIGICALAGTINYNALRWCQVYQIGICALAGTFFASG